MIPYTTIRFSEIIVILVPPTWTRQPSSLVRAQESSSLELECEANGEPGPSITVFKKDGRAAETFFVVKSSLIFLIRVWLVEGELAGRHVTVTCDSVSRRSVQVPRR